MKLTQDELSALKGTVPRRAVIKQQSVIKPVYAKPKDILAARIAALMTQKQAADLIDVTAPAWTRYETGVYKMPEESLALFNEECDKYDYIVKKIKRDYVIYSKNHTEMARCKKLDVAKIIVQYMENRNEYSH